MRTADTTIGLEWPEGTTDVESKMVMPGDNIEVVCELHNDLAADVGTRYAFITQLRMHNILTSYSLVSLFGRVARPLVLALLLRFSSMLAFKFGKFHYSFRTALYMLL